MNVSLMILFKSNLKSNELFNRLQSAFMARNLLKQLSTAVRSGYRSISDTEENLLQGKNLIQQNPRITYEKAIEEVPVADWKTVHSKLIQKKLFIDV